MSLTRSDVVRLLVTERYRLDNATELTAPASVIEAYNTGVREWASQLATKLLGPEHIPTITLRRYKGDALISAIKLVRNLAPNLSLKEAKDLVEQLRGPNPARYLISFADETDRRAAEQSLLSEGFEV